MSEHSQSAITDQPPQLLLLGNHETAEMQPVVSLLTRLAANAQPLHAANLNALSRLIYRDSWHPDLVVVCQNWPDEFSAAEIHRFFELAPLARWVCCFGLWCESDGRNRDLWPLSIRVPARAAEARLRREFAVLKCEQPALPLTASRDEHFEFDNTENFLPKGLKQTVLVKSPDVELRRWIEELLKSQQFQVLNHASHESPPPPSSPHAVIWDVDPWNATTQSQLEDFRNENSQTAIIAIQNFTRPEETAKLQSSGVNRVVAKLASHAVLLNALLEALPQQTRQTG